MAPSLGSMFWRDGQLKGVAFEMDATGTASVRLFLSLYDSVQSTKRKPVAVVGEGVSRFETTLDVAALEDNMRAGNIVGGCLENGILTLELTGGLVAFEAKVFRADAA